MFEIYPVTRPYPGLRPFEAWESSIFFGRETHTDHLLEILDKQHLLVVTGPSGSGKSSLVRAGLIPQLPLGAIGRGVAWRVGVMRPGEHPMVRLAQALLAPEAFGAELNSPEVGPDNHAQARILAELTRGPRGLIDVVANLRQRSTGAAFDFFLLVDQFEEIFTWTNAGTTAANEADEFINLLLAAANMPQAGIYITLTMRTDFFGHCTRFLDLPEAINRTSYLVPRLSRAELERAIAAPARVFGGKLDEVLCNELVNSCQNDPDQLPVLQHALARMWDQRQAAGIPHPELRLQNLHSVGGIEQALASHADEILQTLLSKQGDPQAANSVFFAVQWLFRCISEQRSAEMGGQLVRRPQALYKIAETSGLPWQEFVPVLQAFAQPTASFLNYAGQDDAPAQEQNTVVDISHEALLRQWGVLKEWVEAETRAAAQYRELQRRAAHDERTLLSGRDLESAQLWLETGLGLSDAAQVGKFGAPGAPWAARYVGAASFEVVKQFFDESREAAGRHARQERLRTWAMLGSGGLLVLALMTVSLGGTYVFYQAGVAANAQALWHPLVFDGRTNWYSGDLIHGLLVLTRTDRATRSEAILKSLNNELLLRQLRYGGSAVLDAAIGLDTDLRDAFIRDLFSKSHDLTGGVPQLRRQVILELGLKKHIDIFIDKIATIEYEEPTTWAAASFDSLIAKLTPTEANNVAKRLARELKNQKNKNIAGNLGAHLIMVAKRQAPQAANALAEQLYQTFKDGKSVVNIEIAKTLVALPHKLSSTQESELAKYLFDALINYEGEVIHTDLGNACVTIAEKLSAKQADEFAQRLVAAMIKRQKFFAAYVLVPLASKLRPQQATILAQQLFDETIKEKNLTHYSTILQGLAALTNGFTDKQAWELNIRLLAAEKARAASSFDRPQFRENVEAFTNKLTSIQAAELSNQLINDTINTANASEMVMPAILGKAIPALTLEDSNKLVAKLLGEDNQATGQHTGFAAGLIAVADKLNTAHAVELANNLIDHMAKVIPLEANFKSTGGVFHFEKMNRLRDLTQALARITTNLTEAQNQALATRLLAMLSADIADDSRAILLTRLAAMASNLTGTQREVLINQFLATSSKTRENSVLNEIPYKINELANKLAPKEAQDLAERLLTEAARAQTDFPVMHFTKQASMLSGYAIKRPQDIAQWVELCKSPFADRAAIVAAIRKVDNSGPSIYESDFDYLAWAAKKYGVDVRAPLKTPGAKPKPWYERLLGL